MGLTNSADLGVAVAYIDALNGDDPAAVAALVSDDFRNEHHAELASGCVGRDEYARRLPGFFATFPNRHYTITETVVGELVGELDTDDGPNDGAHSTGSDIVVRYRFGADISGTRIDLPGVMWISVRNGEVARRLDCWDSLTYHRQTGTVPQA